MQAYKIADFVDLDRAIEPLHDLDSIDRLKIAAQSFFNNSMLYGQIEYTMQGAVDCALNLEEQFRETYQEDPEYFQIQKIINRSQIFNDKIKEQDQVLGLPES